MKKILTIDELITHMKKKGIKFEKVSEKEAKEFLSHHNYYLKLSSYRFNYPKVGIGNNHEGEYQNLDFGYLKELSTIDMHLRYLIMEMCLDIEHAIKVQLIDKVSQNQEEDGYNGYEVRFTISYEAFGLTKETALGQMTASLGMRNMNYYNAGDWGAALGANDFKNCAKHPLILADGGLGERS
jgi:hypothetical protein